MLRCLFFAGILAHSQTSDHLDISVGRVGNSIDASIGPSSSGGNNVHPGNLTFLSPTIIKGTGMEQPAGLKPDACSTWNATISVTASYITKIVEADLKVLSDSGCETYEVHLWKMIVDFPQYIPCVNGMHSVMNVLFNFSDTNHIIRFENITAGNYCVRVTPCGSFHCLTLYSNVVELPRFEIQEHAVLARTRDDNGYYFLLLLPLVGIVILLGYLIYRRKKKSTNLSDLATITTMHLPKTVISTPAVPVIKVIYSRDSPQHNEVVACLCSFLEKEVNLKVVYDENAQPEAHVMHDWATVMADVYCPYFSSEPPRQNAVKRVLVIESDGGIIKQDAHHNYKDVGLAAKDFTDEMYHIMYSALLSRQAQALGDYCHIFVARFSYTTTEARLNLVPEKRYILPKHMKELLSALLYTGMPHGYATSLERLDKLLDTEAYQLLLIKMNSMKQSLDENPDLIKESLKTIITS